MEYKKIEQKGLTISIHSKKRIEYKSGQEIGNNGIVYLEEREPYIRKKNIKDKQSNNVAFRKALFRCHCGNEWVTRIDRVKMDKVSSCGCSRTKIKG